jgi:hypothetical protein
MVKRIAAYMQLSKVERSRAMAKRIRSIAGVIGLGVVTLLLAGAKLGQAQAFPTSDRPAGYVVFAKVVVDTSDLFSQGRRLDTIIQLTNLAHDVTPGDGTRAVECFYVDATARCNNGDQPCRDSADCTTGGVCLPQWSETDFTLVLTQGQPVGWRASTGTNLSALGHCAVDLSQCQFSTDCNLSNPANVCVQADGNGIVGPLAPFFVGELKCVEIDNTALPASTVPIVANDLKGEATIEAVSSGASGNVDARAYNAIGFEALANNGDQNLCLGASPGSTNCAVAEYANCPAILVVDHFFDGAEDPVSEATVTSDLTLVPCSENLTNGSGINSQTPTTAQILVFNEFEQRFSTQTSLSCFKETQLSHIDQTLGNESASLFNFAVEGTLTGQTRIRPVLTSDLNNGNGLLAVVEEFHGARSAAYNVDYVGTNGAKGDIVRFSVAP